MNYILVVLFSSLAMAKTNVDRLPIPTLCALKSVDPVIVAAQKKNNCDQVNKSAKVQK